jgi:riboflavin synthase|tara:strand:+ start:417 stop:1010 length:594 start_codon:yes stop_codon:yes gene_type:complete
MFTGIIEECGVIKKIMQEKNNLIIKVQASFAHKLKINQSISHNGICLSVMKLSNDTYSVCAISETIKKTNIDTIQVGDIINLERCLKVGDRFDGHFVQGHIDGTIRCTKITDKNGSWIFQFNFQKEFKDYIIQKGSISINGVSLTIAKINYTEHYFEIAIIPYTFQNTNFKVLKVGDNANVEFDIITKQIATINNRK